MVPLIATPLRRFACLLCVAFAGGCAGEGAYPNRPITIICPWSVGGGTDRSCRQIALFLEHELGIPVNVVNATGGAGVTGHSRGLRARPDGYTLLMMTVEINMLHWRDLTKLRWEDATPLLAFNEDAAALFIRTESPWKNLSDMLADLKANPGQRTASGTAVGGIWHLAVTGLLSKAGLDSQSVKWIPMAGAGPSLQELVGGGLDFVCCSLPEARILTEAGRLRCLGVMSDNRLEQYPTVPTLKEQGIDWSLGGWRGLAVPKETPAPIVDILEKALHKVVSGETVVMGKTFPEFLRSEGFSAVLREKDDFRNYLLNNDATLGDLIAHNDFGSIAKHKVGPMDFPKLLFCLLGLMLAGLLVKATWRPDQQSAMTVPPEPVTLGRVFDLLLVLLLVLAYGWLSEPVGFVLTAGALFIVLGWRLGCPLWKSAAIAAIVVPVIYHAFAHGLRVSLPRGVLGW